MTPREAQIIGRKKTIIATVFSLAIILLILMILETRGDFANGILFFLQAVTNMNAMGIYIILFGLTFLFGGLAGKEIILGEKNHKKVAVKYTAWIMLALSIYFAIIGTTTVQGLAKDLPDFLLNYLIIILPNFFLFIIPLLSGWLWAVNQIKKNTNRTP